MQLHTRRVHPAFQNLFPSAALLSTNLEVFFQHLHYVSVVQNTLSHMETGLLELFSSQPAVVIVVHRVQVPLEELMLCGDQHVTSQAVSGLYLLEKVLLANPFERIWLGFRAFLLHQLLTPLLNFLVPVYDVFLEEMALNETRTAWCVGLPLSCPKEGNTALRAALWAELMGTAMAGALGSPSDLGLVRCYSAKSRPLISLPFPFSVRDPIPARPSGNTVIEDEGALPGGTPPSCQGVWY